MFFWRKHKECLSRLLLKLRDHIPAALYVSFSLRITWLDACTDALCSNEFLFSICEYFKFTVTSDLTKTKFFRVFYQILTTLVWRELPVIWGKVEIYLGKIYLWKNIYQCFSLGFLCKSHIPGNSQLICADNICPLSAVSPDSS